MNPGFPEGTDRMAPEAGSSSTALGPAVVEKGSKLYQIGIIAAAVLLVMSAAIL